MEIRHYVPAPLEPTAPRILPFRARYAPASVFATDGNDDRLLEITSVGESPTMTNRRIHHVRAVTLGASSGAFYPDIPTELTPIAASRLGIATMEIMLQTAGEYDLRFVREIRQNADAHGVAISSVHLVSRLHPFFDAYVRRVEEGRAMFRQGVSAAALLGARVVVWHGPDARDVTTSERWEAFIALTRELVDVCAEAGMTLGIENVSYGALSQVRDVARFATRLEELGARDRIGFVFDPFQSAEAGANPFMMLAAMGNRVVNVHISDYRERDSAARHLAPGDGDLPWSALIRAIMGSGYRGPLVIEGPLGGESETMDRVRQTLDPLIRAAFPFDPDGCDDRPVSALTAPPPGVVRGIELFNQREFLEQHEEIEAEWHAEPGPVRRLYQGILQIGVGFHHACKGNYQGSVALLTEGIEKLSEFEPRTLGIEIGQLAAGTRACLDAIVSAGPDGINRFDASTIPAIRMSSI